MYPPGLQRAGKAPEQGLLRGVQGKDKGVRSRDCMTLENIKRLVLVECIVGAQDRLPPCIPQ